LGKKDWYLGQGLVVAIAVTDIEQVILEGKFDDCMIHVPTVRATAVGRDAVLAGDPKTLDYYVILI